MEKAGFSREKSPVQDRCSIGKGVVYVGFHPTAIMDGYFGADEIPHVLNVELGISNQPSRREVQLSSGVPLSKDAISKRCTQFSVCFTHSIRKEQLSNFPLMPPVFDSHAYQSYQRQRQMTLGDLLLENRIVFLQGEIYTGNANDVVMKLLYLQSENRRKDIHFYINSPGGEVVSTLAIYDTMQMLSCPVATYCVGQAASGGAVLLAGGSPGKRYCLPNSTVMVHQPHGGVRGQVSDIEIQAREILRMRTQLNEILAKHTGKSVEQIAKDTDRDFFLTANEAKEYGLVDQLLTKTVADDEDKS